jgi:hypothetical protein
MRIVAVVLTIHFMTSTLQIDFWEAKQRLSVAVNVELWRAFLNGPL